MIMNSGGNFETKRPIASEYYRNRERKVWVFLDWNTAIFSTSVPSCTTVARALMLLICLPTVEAETWPGRIQAFLTSGFRRRPELQKRASPDPLCPRTAEGAKSKIRVTTAMLTSLFIVRLQALLVFQPLDPGPIPGWAVFSTSQTVVKPVRSKLAVRTVDLCSLTLSIFLGFSLHRAVHVSGRQ